MSDRKYLRRGILGLILMGMLAPWLAIAAQDSISTMFNAPPMWVPESLGYRRTYDWFTDAFQCQDTVIVSYPGATIDDPLLVEFCDRLMAWQAASGGLHPPYFHGAVGGPDLLDQLRTDDLGLTPAAAAARLRGSFIGPDQTSCAAVVLTLEGGLARHKSLEIVERIAADVFPVEASALVLVGAPIDGAEIDRASIASIQKFSIPSTLLAFLLCWLCLRSWSMTLAIVAVAAFGQGLVLALQTFTGEPMNAVLIILPVLVFVLTVSAGVHLANYFLECNDGTSGGERIEHAMRRGWLPCVLAATTTVIGLASLQVSEMQPIRTFSWLASCGVVTTVTLLFQVLPLGMRHEGRVDADLRLRDDGAGTILAGLASVVVRHRVVIMGSFLLGMGWLAWGLMSIETSVNVRSLFPEDSRILHDYRWSEQHLGPLVPIEVVVQFEPTGDLDVLARMELVRDVHASLSRMEEVGGTLSAATFFPRIPKPGGIRQSVRRASLRSQLEQQLPALHDATYIVSDDQNRQFWRVNARVSAMSDLDYGLFLQRIREQVEPLIHRQGGVSALYTGSLPVAYQAQRALLDDLFRSYLTAFTLVALVMMLMMRSIGAGLLAMIPNLFPTLLLFGLMARLGIPVDIGSVMTASVALGIAVDDTLHFLVWYRRETDRGVGPLDAIRACYAHCGKAMIQTSLICGLGLSIYGFSDFLPTRRFATLMLGLLLAALAGDLILLPALLAGPLGRFFRRSRSSTSADISVATHLGSPQS